MKVFLRFYFLIFILLIFSSCNILQPVKKNITKKDEKNFTYLFSEANKNRLLGNSSKSIEQYLSAIDINPNSAASHFYLSTIFIKEKEYETALQFAEKAVDLQPKNFWYTIAKADILSALNRTESAVIIYEELLKNNKKSELLYDRLIRIYSEKKDFINLSRLYEKKLMHIQFDNDLALNLYRLNFNEGNRKKATEVLNELIQKNPGNPKFKALLAEFYISIKELNKAELLFKELIGKYPKNTDVRLSYTYYCKYSSKKEEYFDNVMLLMKSDITINEKINLIISGQYPNFSNEKYIKLLRELYQYHSEEIMLNTLFAEYYIDLGNKEEAIKYVRKATEISNSDFNLVLILFELLYDIKDFDNLYKDSEKYLFLYPNRPKVFLYNGIAAYEINKADTAVLILDRGIDLVIDDNQLLVQFNYYSAESYRKLKNFDKSDIYFEKVLKLNPKFYPALIRYSINLSNRNLLLDKAKQLARECIDNNSEKSIFYYGYSLALFKSGQYLEAKTISEKYINKKETNSKYLELHGDILFSNGNTDDALEYWKLAKIKGNINEHLDYKIINIDNLKLGDLKSFN